MIKNFKSLSKPFELQKKIISYLAEKPAQTIVQIQIGVKSNYHSAISRAIGELFEANLVKPISETTPLRGPNVKLWGLTFWGVFKSFEENIDTVKTFLNYEAYYTDLKWLRVCFQILEEEIGDKWVENRVKLLKNLSGLGDKLAELDVTDKSIIIRTWTGYTQGFLESIHMPPARMRRFSNRMMQVLSAKTEADLLELLKKN
jgi:hypothetical protein